MISVGSTWFVLLLSTLRIKLLQYLVWSVLTSWRVCALYIIRNPSILSPPSIPYIAMHPMTEYCGGQLKPWITMHERRYTA